VGGVTEKTMPITKTGRYSMNPAYAEALDRAEQEKNDADASDGTHDEKAAAKDDGKDAKKTAPKKGAVKRIEIEPAENGGFVSRTQREQSEDDDGGQHDGWAPPYEEPELRAHPDSGHLMKFLAGVLEK
jgi:hypothetical protein